MYNCFYKILIKLFSLLIIIRNVCDTKNWSNGCWKFSFTITEINYIFNKIHLKIYWNRKQFFWIEMMFHNITILTNIDQNKCNLDEHRRLSNRPQTVLYISYSTVHFEHGSSNQNLEAELSFWIAYCIIKIDFWGSIIMLIILIPISCRVPARFRWRGLFGGLSPHRQWLRL